MAPGAKKQVDIARLKADLAAASVELLSAHCAAAESDCSIRRSIGERRALERSIKSPRPTSNWGPDQLRRRRGPIRRTRAPTAFSSSTLCSRRRTGHFSTQFARGSVDGNVVGSFTAGAINDVPGQLADFVVPVADVNDLGVGRLLQDLVTAQKHGGDKILEKAPDTPVIYVCDWNHNTSELTWHVIYGASREGAKLTVAVNASTGEFIRVEK